MTDNLVGASRALRAIEEEIEYFAPTEATILITGETGVGKEVVARRIHQRSQRRGRFVALNCAGVPDALLESELFGHMRGSFTGAHRDTRGWLEQAKGGTIFLDEVGEMSVRMQALLLRFVEHREVQRVGSEQVQTLDRVRIITATNRDLVNRVAEGAFREDLYYRLNVVHLKIPPLRDRPDDIAPLLTYFLEAFSRAYQVARPAIAEPTMALLTAYPWPGNVRQLSNVIERLVVRHRAGVIAPEDLPTEVSRGERQGTSDVVCRPRADALYDRMVGRGESFWTVIYDPFRSHNITCDDVRAVVARGLEDTRGSYKLLAQRFNLSAHDYRRFLNFLQKYGCRLPFHEFRNPPSGHVRPSPRADPSQEATMNP